MFYYLGLHRRPLTQADVLSPQVKIFGASSVIIHPENNIQFDYDVALVRILIVLLEFPITLIKT